MVLDLMFNQAVVVRLKSWTRGFEHYNLERPYPVIQSAFFALAEVYLYVASSRDFSNESLNVICQRQS